MSRTLRSLMVVGAIVLAACLTFLLPTPIVMAAVTDHATVALAPGDSITITGYFHLTGNTSGLDSIRTTLEQPPGGVIFAKVVGPSITQVVYQIARPATAISGKVCVASLFIGTQTITVNSCASWSYTPPGAVADSVKIARIMLAPHDNIAVLAGGQVQFCTFIVFADSMVAMRDHDALTCDGSYQRYVPAARQVYGSMARQAVADSLCIQYEAAGGTITNESCAAQRTVPTDGAPAGRT